MALEAGQQMFIPIPESQPYREVGNLAAGQTNEHLPQTKCLAQTGRAEFERG